jgi:hypothetical protein
LQVSWPATVLWNASEKKFRCWYSGYDIVQSSERRWLPGYTESPDGLHWLKPQLGQVTFLGRPTNQIRSQPNTLVSLVCENSEPNVPGDPALLQFVDRAGSNYQHVFQGTGVFFRWHAVDALWRRVSGHSGDRPSFQDICQLMYTPNDPDPHDRIKACSQIMRARHYDGRAGIRHIGLAHGADIGHFGCPNVFNSWPREYSVTGTLTKHPVRLGRAGLWLNAEGGSVTVAAASPLSGRRRVCTSGSMDDWTIYAKRQSILSAAAAPSRG